MSTSRCIPYTDIDGKTVYVVSPISVPFTDKKTGSAMTFQSMDMKYNFAAPGGPAIIDDFLFNGPVCVAAKGISVPKKKPEDNKRAPLGALPPANGYPQHGGPPMGYNQYQPQHGGPQGYNQYPPQHSGYQQQPQMQMVQANAPAEAPEETMAEVWKFWPKDAKDIEPMRLKYHDIWNVAVEAISNKPECCTKTAGKEGIEKIRDAAQDFVKLTYFVPTNNKKPIPGAKASYKAKHRYDSIYQWPHDPKDTKAAANAVIDAAELRNKHVTFIPKIRCKSIYIGADLASVQFHVAGAIILDVKEAGADNAASDVNAALMADPVAAAEAVKTAGEALARIRALKNKAKERKDEDEDEGAGTDAVVSRTDNIRAPSSLPALMPPTNNTSPEQKFDNANSVGGRSQTAPTSFQIQAPPQQQHHVINMQQPQITPTNASVPQVFSGPPQMQGFGQPPAGGEGQSNFNNYPQQFTPPPGYNVSPAQQGNLQSYLQQQQQRSQIMPPGSQ